MLKDWSFPAERKELPKMLSEVSNFVAEYVGDDKVYNRLKVCVEEILVNIADYSQSKVVNVSCEFDEKEKNLKFEFVDEGVLYNPLESVPEVDIDAGIEERGIGGLGIFLYTTIMDKMEYRSDDGKNHLIAIKKLSDEELK